MATNPKMLSVFALAAAFAASSCAQKSKPETDRLIAKLRAAMGEEVDSEQATKAHNDLVKQVVEEGVLERKRRSEIEGLFGKGQTCANSTLCSRRQFGYDDWFYDVGVPSPSKVSYVPVLLVGFDSGGVCVRVNYTLREPPSPVR